MSYSTGSGDYNALMAAVLAHCVGDGWIEAGGIGTGWPISKGTIRGVDWATSTEAATDYTTGAGVAHTTRWINIAIGSTTSDATTRAGNGEGANIPNMEYVIDQWYIFSDPTLCDYVNVVIRFSNGTDAQVFGHISFGELDKHGMGHSGVAFSSAHPVRGFSPDTKNDRNNGNEAHSGIYARIRRIFTGRLGYNYTTYLLRHGLAYMIDPLVPVTSVVPTWPQPNILHNDANVLDVYGPSDNSFEPNIKSIGDEGCKLNCAVEFTSAQPYSGGVSFGALPLFITNSITNSLTLQFMNVGDFPNARVCSMINYLPADEITFGGDTWVLFPFLCKKARSTLGQQYTVTSGEHGLAYKKVV